MYPQSFDQLIDGCMIWDVIFISKLTESKSRPVDERWEAGDSRPIEVSQTVPVEQVESVTQILPFGGKLSEE